MIGAISMSLITIVPTIIVSIACPVFRDTATTVALELGAGTGMATPVLITVVPAVIVVITAPIDVDASPAVTSELSEGEAGWISTLRRFI